MSAQTISVVASITGGGQVLQSSRNVSVDNVIVAAEAIAAGKTGTAGAAGVMTLGTGHGLTTANVVSVTWAVGRRYDCSITAYDSTTITLGTGAGDSLPTAGAVVVSSKTEIDLAFNGAELQAISIGGDQPFIVALEDVSTVKLEVDTVANSTYQWDSGNGVTNPLAAAAPIKANAYAKAAVAGTLKILVGYLNG